MSASSAATSVSVGVNAAARVASDIEAVFDRCGDGLYRYFVVRTGGDTHLADDLMQQLWLQAGACDTCVPTERVEFWLRAIAKNLICGHWRTNARRPAHVPIADPRLAAELAERLVSEELPAEALEQREIRDQLLLALTALPNDEQVLLLEYYFHEVPQAELGRRLGVGPRAVEGRLYRARQTLRQVLEELE